METILVRMSSGQGADILDFGNKNLESSIAKMPINRRIHFHLMVCFLRLRDLFHPPDRILLETGMRSGMKVLDYGCGPGSFSIAAARLVGRKGLVFALDINPLAIASVKRSARMLGMDNVRPLPGSSLDDLPEGKIDIALLYDVLHEIAEPAALLNKIHKVLKPGGLLSVRDHHMPVKNIIETVTGTPSFRFAGRRHTTLRFEPVSGSGHAG
jgi:ubiquinone/menaquinone biosynthesis C-methylase UbiE